MAKDTEPGGSAMGLVIPAIMLVLLGVELAVVSWLWKFPFEGWKSGGSIATTALIAVGMTALGIFGNQDPNTRWHEDVHTNERVHIDGKQAVIRRTERRDAPIGRMRAILYLVGGILMFIGVAIALAFLAHAAAQPPTPVTAKADKKAKPTTPEPAVKPEPAKPEPVKPEPAPPEQDPTAEILAAATWADAIKIARPDMGIEDDGSKTTVGAKLLAAYGAARPVKWADVDKKPQTTVGRVQKDVDEERGKPLCATGDIGNIAKQEVHGHKVFLGTLTTARNEPIAFYAVRSTGDLVAGNQAKLCGIVTGTLTVVSQTGVRSAAAFVVGMFDLKANR